MDHHGNDIESPRTGETDAGAKTLAKFDDMMTQDIQFMDQKDDDGEFMHRNDLNSTQTNALLNIEDNQFNLILQQVYYSPKCSYFYVTLLFFSFVLILVTIFDGFKVTKSPLFIVLETLLNVLIGADFILRLKLVGREAFFTNP